MNRAGVWRGSVPLAWALLFGCGRPDATGPAETKPARTASRPSSDLKLRNWVLEPPVADSERATRPLRVVCAAPSATEICCALGWRDGVVGRTRYCRYPPGIEAVTAIGAADDTNTEALRALHPDLVLVAGTSRVITDRLERLGLRFASLPDQSLADIFTAIERVGAATGRPETAARLCAGLRAELEQVRRRYAGVPAARVLLLLGVLSEPPTAPFTAGPGSFHDDLLRLAGHQNVADVGARAYGPMSLEMIVRSDPDVIIELDADGRGRPGGDAEARRAWSQFRALRAVANRRVYALKGQHHHVPGPRIALSFAELCGAIAGERDE